jgi:hypothetical protein
MSNKRDNKFKKTGISFLRLLLVITMVQFLFAGTLPSQAAPAADVDSVTDFDLMQSVDRSTWIEVPGDPVGGFTMTLNPIVEFYYLNVANLTASPDLKEAYHPFVVTAKPAGFFAYWAALGVYEDCTGDWQPVMWEIINGRQPIFYLKVDSGPSYMLVDGLTRATGGADDFLRVNGSYLPGNYTFTGTITDTTESTSQLPVNITFKLIQYPLSVSKTGNGSGTVTSNPAGIDCGVICTYDLDHGTVVTLTATAATGSTFDGWNGEGCTGSGTCVVTMSAARSVTANFTLNHYTFTVNKDGTGSGSVTSNPAGIDCGGDCSNEYDYGTVITLTATADTGSAFKGWSGATCSGTGDCIVTISAAETVTATFNLQRQLTVNKDGSGSGTVSSNPAGIDCGGDCTNVYDYGTVITLTATADTGSAFKGWSGVTCPGTGDCVMTISAAETVTATFNSQRQLTVNKDGSGSGTVTSNPAGIDCGATCANDFDYNTIVTLTATADTGSTFSGWNGATCTGSGDCLVTMSAAETVTATFTLNQYILDVFKTGSGAVSSNPAGIDCGSDCSEDYDYGTVVTLTATPDSGWGFFGWEGDVSSSTNPITITIDGDKSVTAVFKQYFVFLPTVRRDPVFADDFNYADPDQVWLKWEQIAETSATWFIQGNEFHGKHIVTDRNAKAVARVYAPQMPASYSVEAKVKLASGSVEGARCGLLFDFLDNTRTYRFVIMPGLASGDNWLVQERNPTLSRWDTLPGGTGRASMLSRDDYNLLRVVRQGASIKVYLNDMLTPLWSGSDSTFVNGRAGLNIGTPVDLVTGTYVEVIFDDFLIDNLR